MEVLFKGDYSFVLMDIWNWIRQKTKKVSDDLLNVLCVNTSDAESVCYVMHSWASIAFPTFAAGLYL